MSFGDIPNKQRITGRAAWSALALVATLAIGSVAQAQPSEDAGGNPASAAPGTTSVARSPRAEGSGTRRAARASRRTASKAKRTRSRRSATSAADMAAFAALKGSRDKVQGTYYNTVATGVTFYQSMDDARAAITAGKFVPLYGNLYYATYHMTLAYATPQAKAFIEAFAPQFVEHCDEMMVVTSALRPKDRTPRNGSPWTVHPTGMAVDIRKPRNQQCMGWVRQALLDYQNQGYVDATEEFHPPHFHVAVKKPIPAPARVVSTSNGEVTAVVR